MSLAACATSQELRVAPEKYRDYKDFFIDRLNSLQYPWPAELAHKLNMCGADVWFQHVTQAEIEMLNRYVRGEISLKKSESDRLEGEVERRMGGQKGIWVLMNKQCPEVIKEAEPYRKN